MDEDILNINLFTPEAIITIATELDLPSEFQLNAEIQEETGPRKRQRTGQQMCSNCGKRGHQARSGKCREEDVVQFRQDVVPITEAPAITLDETFGPIEVKNMSDDEQAPPDELDFMGLPVIVDEDDAEQYVPDAQLELPQT